MIEVRNAGDKRAEILIYDQIGKGFFEDGVTAKQFAADIRALGKLDVIDVRINSPGGSVFEGLAIYNTLDRHAAHINVFIDGSALSMASVISMVGDTVHMAENALMMMHNPHMGAVGDANDMRKAAEILDKHRSAIVTAYTAKSGKSDEQIEALLDEETWLTAEEAFSEGFVDAITNEVETVAAFQLPEIFDAPKHLSAHVSALFLKTPAPTAEPENLPPKPEPDMSDKTEPAVATLAELKACCPGASPDFLLNQIEANATVASATTAFIAMQNSQLAAKEKEVEEAKAKAEADAKAAADAKNELDKAKAKPPGNDPVTNDGDGDSTTPTWQGSGSPRDIWNHHLRELRSRGMDYQQACFQIDKDNPGLREAMVNQYQPSLRPRVPA